MAKACCWLVLLTLLVFNGKELLVEGREIDQIEHVVIFMQENRAFDHYFGTLSGVRGFNDRAAPFLPSGLPVWYQPVAPDQESNAKQGGGNNNNNNNNNNSYILPFHVDSQRTSATCMDAPAMGWSPDIEMYNSGLNDAWNTARDPGYGMGYFERSDLPYYYALADAFSISDQYFQSVFSSTNPNRLFFFSGCCGLSAGYPPATDNTEPVPGFQWETIAQVFEAQNISWRVYQQVDHFDDNGFAWFEVFQKAVPGTPLYDKGKQPVPNIVTAFDQDMTAGALPQVSIIIAPEALSEHANNHPAAGEDLSARLIAALASHPDVYAKTVFILNYDEGGQFFDHHWPPTPPMNSSEGLSTVDVTDELVNGIKTVGPSTPYGPLGMGWRVPLIVVSPWTRGGWVNSQVSDHTSVLRFLEHRFNITFSTISEWRRTVAGDLLSFFNFSNPDYSWPTLPNTNGYVEAADRQCSTLPMPVIPTDQSLPTQETGVRPSHTLPYQLYVADALLKDPTGLGSQLGLTIINAGQAGAAFQVYDLNQASNAPRKYTVSAGLNLTDSWQLGAASYNLSLHGPNGFVRMLWGQVPASLAYPCWCQQLAYDLIDGNLMLLLQAASDSPAACTFTITPNAYLSSGPMPVTVSPGSQSIFNISVASSGNWYDVTVQADAYHYGRRYMGRIERPGCTSDPAASSPEPVLLFPSFSHPTSHPPIPAHVRKFRDLSAIPTHKDQRCFEAEYEPFYEHVCASPIRH